MAKAALLRVNGGGEVVASNDVAERWLGTCVGQPCHALIADPSCAERCAARLRRTGGTKGVDACTVRDRPATLTCAALGDEVVVALQAATDDPPLTPLSEREREVLGFVGQGFTNRRVSQRLGLSMSTVRTHMERILDKLGVRTRAAAIRRAIATGQLADP
ncbi:MAG: LuxR C-terminal-related transcriptional regulator [Myxococcota bacterium]